MCDISFILPTVRPYNQFAEIVVTAIQEFMNDSTYTYEFLVYTQQYVPNVKNVKWLKEQQTSNGPVVGYNESFKESSGKYIYLLNDKWKPNAKILKAVPFLQSDEFKDRKFKVTSVNVHSTFTYDVTGMPIKGSNREKDLNLPQELLHPRFLEPKHKYAIFGFPVYERETVLNHLSGYLLTPYFIAHYHDNWLSFYIGEQGEFPLLCLDTWMDIFGGGSLCRSDAHDFQVFCKLAIDLINKRNLNYV